MWFDTADSGKSVAEFGLFYGYFGPTSLKNVADVLNTRTKTIHGNIVFEGQVHTVTAFCKRFGISFSLKLHVQEMTWMK